MVTRFLSCQPDVPESRRWLVLALADVALFPGCGPVFVPESSHDCLTDARLALEAANAADAPAPEQAPAPHGAREAPVARDARGAP